MRLCTVKTNLCIVCGVLRSKGDHTACREAMTKKPKAKTTSKALERSIQYTVKNFGDK